MRPRRCRILDNGLFILNLSGSCESVMTRVILAPNDVLTPFDLRAQNFRVIVEFSTCHREQKFFSKKCPKVTFWLEKKF